MLCIFMDVMLSVSREVIHPSYEYFHEESRIKIMQDCQCLSILPEAEDVADLLQCLQCSFTPDPILLEQLSWLLLLLRHLQYC